MPGRGQLTRDGDQVGSSMMCHCGTWVRITLRRGLGRGPGGSRRHLLLHSRMPASWRHLPWDVSRDIRLTVCPDPRRRSAQLARISMRCPNADMVHKVQFGPPVLEVAAREPSLAPEVNDRQHDTTDETRGERDATCHMVGNVGNGLAGTPGSLRDLGMR